MSGFKEKGQGRLPSKQPLEHWVIVVWDGLAIVFLLLAIYWAGIGYLQKTRMKPLEVKPLIPAGNEQMPDRTLLEQSWIAFDAYEPYFLNRDLFVTAEEKAVAATPVVSQAPVVLSVQWGDGYQLAGVLLDQKPTVVIKVSNPPGVVMLAVGDLLGDAVLKKVEDNQAVFEYQGQMFILKMDENKGL